MDRWRKLGRIYEPAGRHPLLASHAANPLALQIDGDLFRIFYSGRDHLNRSSVGAVDIDIIRRRVVCDHEAPFFAFGGSDSCYPDGVSVGTSYETSEGRFILFMGWQTGGLSHWRGDIGRLRVTRDLRLETERSGPFIGTSEVDPFSLSYPWVMKRDGLFHMWYGSTLTWKAPNGEMIHVLNYGTSPDGETWQMHGQAVPHELGVAQAFSRPTVLPSRDGLEMWFSYRSGTGTPYRIGKAVKVGNDGWKLALDRAGIDVSTSGWDSDMVCYPFVFEHAGEQFMLYNGNGFGATGFGLAVRER